MIVGRHALYPPENVSRVSRRIFLGLCGLVKPYGVIQFGQRWFTTGLLHKVIS